MKHIRWDFPNHLSPTEGWVWLSALHRPKHGNNYVTRLYCIAFTDHNHLSSPPAFVFLKFGLFHSSGRNIKYEIVRLACESVFLATLTKSRCILYFPSADQHTSHYHVMHYHNLVMRCTIMLALHITDCVIPSNKIVGLLHHNFIHLDDLVSITVTV